MLAHLDCFSGVSGDKFLGALVGAGLPVDTLRERLAALDLPGWSIDAAGVTRDGIAGTLVTVRVDADQPSRTWSSIRTLIEDSALAAPARDDALRAFGLLAEAEAAVHGVAVDDVHFHEVGALDSIIDIVGTAVGLRELGVDAVWATPVRLGHGTVETAHGTLPVPAPATGRLLEGLPVYAGDIAGEMTTPTGAALLRAFVTRWAPLPPSRIVAEGFGAGTRQIGGLPNLLRMTLAEPEPDAAWLEEVALLETSIDHVSPEIVAAALALLLEQGALDAWSAPVSMKKGRCGTAVTVVCTPADAARLTAELMRHTGTLGVRRSLQWRAVAPRRLASVATSLGLVRVKIAGEGDSLVVRPESDDVAAIARSSGLPLETAARRLAREAEDAVRAGRDEPRS